MSLYIYKVVTHLQKKVLLIYNNDNNNNNLYIKAHLPSFASECLTLTILDYGLCLQGVTSTCYTDKTLQLCPFYRLFKMAMAG